MAERPRVPAAEQMTKTEDVFRQANERVRDIAAEYGMDGRIPFFCECADAGCRAMVLLALSEYEAIRAHEARFLTVPGHQAAMAGAAVVERNSRYVVVEEPRASAPAHRRD